MYIYFIYLSISRSMSEGDNSVFSETGVTPVHPSADKLDQDNGSGNESEEVDDIELIFTTDESKDISNLQVWHLVNLQTTYTSMKFFIPPGSSAISFLIISIK